MARNKNAILEGINKQGTVQVIEGVLDAPTKVMVCGKKIEIVYGKNPKNVTSIKVDGEYHSTSAITSKADACAKIGTWLLDADENTSENNVTFTDGEYIYINGNKKLIFELVKDIDDYKTFYNILSEQTMNGLDWQREIAEKIREWFRDGGIQLWLEYRYYVEYGETIDETCLNVDDDESDLTYPWERVGV